MQRRTGAAAHQNLYLCGSGLGENCTALSETSQKYSEDKVGRKEIKPADSAFTTVFVSQWERWYICFPAPVQLLCLLFYPHLSLSTVQLSERKNKYGIK